VTFGPRAALAFLATALLGCAGNEPQPELFDIQPNRAYSNHDVRLRLLGADLIPSFRVNPSTDQRVAIMDGFSGRIGKGSFWAPLTHFGWLGPEQLSATLPSEDAEELVRTPPICPCDVELTDPRGRKAILTDAFEELGPDKDAPTITCESPVAGKPYCPGGTMHAHCTIEDPAPGYLSSVTWSLRLPLPDREPLRGSCPFEVGSSRVECAFDVLIDKELAPGQELYLLVNAVDSADNTGRAIAVVLLSDPPTVKSVVPNAGPVTGGTDIIIRGIGFDSDSQALFGDQLLYPNGGVVLEKGTIISGYAPAHAKGEVSVKVISRLGEVVLPNAFEYLDSAP
jgi:hypothetical protein